MDRLTNNGLVEKFQSSRLPQQDASAHLRIHFICECWKNIYQTMGYVVFGGKGRPVGTMEVIFKNLFATPGWTLS